MPNGPNVTAVPILLAWRASREMESASARWSPIGDTNSMGTFSGIPYFFLQAGRRIGLFRRGSRSVRSGSVAAG